MNRTKKKRKPRQLKPGEALYAAESIKPGVSKVEAARRAHLDYVPSGAHVQRFRQEILDRNLQAADATVENIVRELLRVALFDPRRMFTDDGMLLPITALGDDEAACIGGLEVEQRREGRGETAEHYTVLKIKIADKNAALRTLAQFHYDNKGNLKIPGSAPGGGALIPPPIVEIHFGREDRGDASSAPALFS